jgi:hypothetical protein
MFFNRSFPMEEIEQSLCLVPVYEVGKVFGWICVCSESASYKACEVRKYGVSFS